MQGPVRRIVTTHDAQGRSVLLSDTSLTVAPIPSGDAEMALVWTTGSVPADNIGDDAGDRRAAGLTLNGGSVIRIVDMQPGCASPMHRSHSIDYGIVVSGELDLVLDGGECTRLRPGDIVVQRGTNHLWRNPSDTEMCRVVFVLIEARPVVVDGTTLPPTHL